MNLSRGRVDLRGLSPFFACTSAVIVVFRAQLEGRPTLGWLSDLGQVTLQLWFPHLNNSISLGDYWEN